MEFSNLYGQRKIILIEIILLIYLLFAFSWIFHN